MFLRDLLFSCLRRWYFLLLGLLLTGAGTYYVYLSIEPTYEANASVVLIPPKVAVMTGDNPYLYLGGLDQALGVLQVKVASPEVLDKLTGGREDAEVSIGKDATTSGPIAAIKVSAKDAAGTMQLLDAALKQVPQTLDELQTPPGSPALRRSRRRPTGRAIGGVGYRSTPVARSQFARSDTASASSS